MLFEEDETVSSNSVHRILAIKTGKTEFSFDFSRLVELSGIRSNFLADISDILSFDEIRSNPILKTQTVNIQIYIKEKT